MIQLIGLYIPGAEMKILKFNNDMPETRYVSDCERIQNILSLEGFDYSLFECYTFWESYSEMSAASWLRLPESDEELLEALT